MTFVTAVDQLVTVVSGLPASPIGSESFGDSFVHLEDGGGQDPTFQPKPRRFWFDVEDHSVKQPESAPFRRIASMKLTVAYRVLKNRFLFIKALAEDYRIISNGLLDSTGWDVVNSKIVAVSQGDTFAVPVEIEEFDDGVVYAVYSFPLEYRE